jgi:biotin carboxyl carrier protein
LAEIRAPITGNVWKILAVLGQKVESFEMVAIIESMKLEIPVESETDGTVVEILVSEGDAIGEDDVMFVLD